MQQLQTPVIFTNQTVAVPLPGTASPYGVMRLDVTLHPTNSREGYVTIAGRQGWVVQSYPPILDGMPAFFLYQWLDLPGVSVWNSRG